MWFTWCWPFIWQVRITKKITLHYEKDLNVSAKRRIIHPRDVKTSCSKPQPHGGATRKVTGPGYEKIWTTLDVSPLSKCWAMSWMMDEGNLTRAAENGRSDHLPKSSGCTLWGHWQSAPKFEDDSSVVAEVFQHGWKRWTDWLTTCYCHPETCARCRGWNPQLWPTTGCCTECSNVELTWWCLNAAAKHWSNIEGERLKSTEPKSNAHVLQCACVCACVCVCVDM